MCELASKENDPKKLLDLITKINQALEEFHHKLTPHYALTRTSAERQRTSFLDPYYLAFQAVTRGAAIEAIFEEPCEEVSMVYSYQSEYGANAGGRAKQLWNAMKRGYEHGHRMGVYQTASPKDVYPLQAADIFAYELSHEFENRVKRPAADMRWGLRQIVGMYKIPSLQILLFDRKELLRRVKESHWEDQTGVEELSVDQERSAQENMMKWLIERGKFNRDDFAGFIEAMRANSDPGGGSNIG